MLMVVTDAGTYSDTDYYETDYDFETRLDFTTGPTLSDGSGTVDRGDYDTLAGITASGTIDYYNSAISPNSGDVDVWILCSEVTGSPWSDTTLTAGVFSLTVDSDDEVGLDTYNFIVVEEGAGSGGSDLCHASHTDTYIADRIVVTITADDTDVLNGVQVNFTLSLVYDYDGTPVSGWLLNITNDGALWFYFNAANASLCNDTDSSTTNIYTAATCTESTHGISAFVSNSESVTWSALLPTTTPPTTTFPTTTVTETGIFYDLFLSLEIWGLFGPLGLVIVGYFVAKKEPKIGILFFVVECVVVAQYLALVAVTPHYWWHAIIILLGGVFTCLGPLIDR